MFTDANGESTGVGMFGLGGDWAKHGQPRWRGYLLWGISIVGGVLLMLTSGPEGFDLLSFGGILFVLAGIGGVIEVFLGRPFRRQG